VDKFKKSTKVDDLTELFDVSDEQLEHALESYLEQSEEKQSKPKLLNFVTYTGFAFLAVCFFAIMQLIIPFSFNFEPLMQSLPIIGGLMVVLIGLGFFSRERRSKKKKERIAVVNKKKAKAKLGATSATGASGIDSFGLKTKKRLFKSRTDKKILGICGGLADYLGVDSTFIRILFVVFLFIGSGSPGLIYLLLGMLLDKEPKNEFKDL
jgi:phage shock protein C